MLENEPQKFSTRTGYLLDFFEIEVVCHSQILQQFGKEILAPW
jgi:hypothetical protein